jgi:hypothetical protein
MQPFRDVTEISEGAEMAHHSNWRIYRNDRYQVIVEDLGPKGASTPIKYLSIKRRDQQPIHDWRDLQAIKNELVGPECEGVELYPAESRLVDTSNQYHLFVVDQPGWRWPFGFNERLVMTQEEADEVVPSAVQRPFDQSRAARRRRQKEQS